MRAEHHNCLDVHFVLVTPKLTNTPSKSTKGTSTIKTMETAQKSMFPNYRTLTSSLADSLAKVSRLLESGRDLTTREARYFLRLLGFLKPSNPVLYCSKTSKVYYPTMTAKHSEEYSESFANWGIGWNGRFLTARISAFPRTGSGSSLSDILEKKVDKRYFLSGKMVKQLMKDKGRFSKLHGDSNKGIMLHGEEILSKKEVD